MIRGCTVPDPNPAMLFGAVTRQFEFGQIVSHVGLKIERLAIQEGDHLIAIALPDAIPTAEKLSG